MGKQETGLKKGVFLVSVLGGHLSSNENKTMSMPDYLWAGFLTHLHARAREPQRSNGGGEFLHDLHVRAKQHWPGVDFT